MKTRGVTRRKRAAYVLVSGGLDSATCAAFYLSEGFDVTGLFVDYGQPAARREARAARGVAGHYGFPLERVACAGLSIPREGFILGRNALLICLAVTRGPTGLLCVGIHAGTPYADCAASFLQVAQAVVDVYCDGTLRVAAPFVGWSKQEVWSLANQLGVPVELTHSCERGASPCGECASCRDRASLRCPTC